MFTLTNQKFIKYEDLKYHAEGNGCWVIKDRVCKSQDCGKSNSVFYLKRLMAGFEHGSSYYESRDKTDKQWCHFRIY